MKIMRGILALAGMCGIVLTCGTCFSVPDDLDTQGCINQCTVELEECLNVDIPCPFGDTCLWELDQCFDKVSDCSKDCSGCGDENTCPEGEVTCVDRCSDMANGCTDMITGCIEYKEQCLIDEKNEAMTCLPVYGRCAGACVGEAEDAIRDMI